MSTILPETSTRVAEHHAAYGVDYLAAPVFGRPEAAAARKLWICVSGPGAAKDRVRPVFDAIGQGVFDFGEAAGAANVVKLMGNFMINAAVEAMAEASAVVERNGIGRSDFLAMMTQTLFNAPVYQNYARKLVAANYREVGFTLALGLKDVELMLKTAGAARSPLPLGGLMRDRFLSAMAKGRQALDAAAFALGAAEDAGLEWFR
jgi:3-hydroxyisobutyrate dehydrogenase-like beta-hydroxyacid dehydrogenase